MPNGKGGEEERKKYLLKTPTTIRKYLGTRTIWKTERSEISGLIIKKASSSGNITQVGKWTFIEKANED